MTYLNDEIFDKAIIVDPLFKKLDNRLAHTGKFWNARQTYEVKCYAQDARNFFKDILLESLNTFEDYQIRHSYYPIHIVYPFTKAFGDPFLAIVEEDRLESVEKLVCLILFSEHIIAFCESTYPSSSIDFEYGEGYASADLIHEFDDLHASDKNPLRIDIQPVFNDELSLESPVQANNVEREIEEILHLVALRNGSVMGIVV